jgi:hypothetical protein
MLDNKKEGKGEEAASSGEDFVQADEALLSEQNSSYNPLREEVEVRDYTKSVGANDATPVVERVMEPKFQTPPPPPPKKDGAQFMGQQATQPAGNPQMQDLPQKDKIEAAKMLTETILSAYKSVCALAGKAVTVSDEQIMNWVIEDKIGLELKIPYARASGEVAEITVRDFYLSFNEQATEAFAVSPQFIDDVRPVMIRVFAKHNWGMTDEQYLLQAFGKEVLTKGLAFVQIKRNLNSVNQTLFGIWQELKQSRSEVGGPSYSHKSSPSTVEANPVAEEEPAVTKTNPQQQAASQENKVTRTDAQYIQTYDMPSNDPGPLKTDEEIINNANKGQSNTSKTDTADAASSDVSEVPFVDTTDAGTGNNLDVSDNNDSK